MHTPTKKKKNTLSLPYNYWENTQRQAENKRSTQTIRHTHTHTHN